MEHWLEIDKKAVLFIYFLVYFVNGKFLRIEFFLLFTKFKRIRLIIVTEFFFIKYKQIQQKC